MKELKRIFLGEFFDDLQISDRIVQICGGEPHDHGPDEKIGIERLGASDICTGFGATLIIGSLVILLTIIITVVLVLVKKRCSEKCNARI